MKIHDVLIKPMLSEKSSKLQDLKTPKYAFKVSLKANKYQIKQAVESFYNVKVAEINTIVTPKKAKSRMTKKNVLKGFKSSFKKAIVTLQPDQKINIYNENN